MDRVSHDLNLRDNPRASIVDQMLSSLNPNSRGSQSCPPRTSTSLLESAPVPNVPAGPRKYIMPRPHGSLAALPEPTRDRPGLFKRFWTKLKRHPKEPVTDNVPSLPPLQRLSLTIPRPPTAGGTIKQSVDLDALHLTDNDRSHAKLLFEGDESIAPKSEAAAWLGGHGMNT